MAYEDEKVTAFAAGVLLGGLVGAGTALLLAPQSGERTRRKIRHAAEDIGGRAEETLEHAAEDAKRAAERSGQKVRRSVERSRDKLNL